MVEMMKHNTSFGLGQSGLLECRGISFLVWFLGAYIVLVPSLSLFPSVLFFNEKRALQIGVLVIAGGVLLFSPVCRRQWLSTYRGFPSLARWGLGLTVGIGGLSSSLAPSPFYAFLEVGHFVLLFVLAGAVASVVRQEREGVGRLFLGFVGLSALLYTVHFIVGYGMYLAYPDIPIWPDGTTNFANIRFFNHYQTWTLPLLVGSVLALPRRRYILKAGLFGITVVWWALVFASNVRGTIGAIFVAAFGVGLLFRGRSKKWISIVAGSALGGIALYFLLFSGGGAPPVVKKFGDPSQYPWRIQRWLTSLEMAWAHPWLGVGPMHFAWPPFRFTAGASPHNTLMQWLAEWGIPATVFAAGSICWGGWSWIQQERGQVEPDSVGSESVRVALVAAVLAGAAHSMVSGVTLAPLSQMLLVLVGGWAWGRYRHDGRPTVVSFGPGAQAALLAVVLGSTLIVGSSLRDLADARERREAFRKSVEHNVFSPRYWTQGYIGVRDSSVMEGVTWAR